MPLRCSSLQAHDKITKQYYAAITMIPGIVMSILAIFTYPYHRKRILIIAAVSFIVTCTGSILYHTHEMKMAQTHCAPNKKYLRLDVFTQQIAAYTPFFVTHGIRPFLVVAPLIAFIYNTDLSIPSEVLPTLIVNVLIFMLILLCMGKKYTVPFIIALASYCLPTIYNLSLWHIFVHITVLFTWHYYYTLKK